MALDPDRILDQLLETHCHSSIEVFCFSRLFLDVGQILKRPSYPKNLNAGSDCHSNGSTYSYGGSLPMCPSPTGTNPQLKINSRFLPFIDKLLIAGRKPAQQEKVKPINKVVHLVPEWKRGDCWRLTTMRVEGLQPAEKPKVQRAAVASFPSEFPPPTSAAHGRLVCDVKPAHPWTKPRGEHQQSPSPEVAFIPSPA